MLEFLPGIVYFHRMNLYTHKMKFSLSGITVLIFYTISLVLAPWFHLHPGEYHPGPIGDGYHSHAEPFKAPISEHSEDDHQTDESYSHLGETITALDVMAGVARVNPSNIIHPAKFSLIVNTLISTSSEICQNQLSRKHPLSLLSPQPPQEYCLLTATNLSPPQA